MKPIHTARYDFEGITCDNNEYVILVNNRSAGAGVEPIIASGVYIIGYQLRSYLSTPGAFCMLGKTQPYGDVLTEYLYGPGDTGLKFYPSGCGFPFYPSLNIPVQLGDGTDQLHLHYKAQSGEPNPRIELTLAYLIKGEGEQ